MTVFIKNKKITVSVYFAAMITFVAALSPDGYAMLSLVCCLLHEAGHLAAMVLVGCKVRGISFGVYGMRIDTDQLVKTSPSQEIFVASGGPIINLIMVIVGVAIKNQPIVLANVVLLVFNLLPIESTDGYSILKSFFEVHFDGEKVKAALKIVSAAFLFLLYCFSFLLLFKSRYNFSALGVSIYLTLKFLFQENQRYR